MSKPKYPVFLTEEELKAIPVLFNMAYIYSWELYDKKEGDKYYEQHKENIELIKNYHGQGYQGVLAVGSMLESVANQALDDLKINILLEPYINYVKDRE
jgi:hypothetical protein